MFRAFRTCVSEAHHIHMPIYGNMWRGLTHLQIRSRVHSPIHAQFDGSSWAREMGNCSCKGDVGGALLSASCACFRWGAEPAESGGCDVGTQLKPSSTSYTWLISYTSGRASQLAAGPHSRSNYAASSKLERKMLQTESWSACFLFCAMWRDSRRI